MEDCDMGVGFAHTVIVGRLGQNPELRYTQGGTGVTQLSVAVDHSYRKGGEWVDDPEWYRVVVWDRGEFKAAEKAAEVLRKGSLVLVAGRMKTRAWTDKEGVKRYTTELIADRVAALADYQKPGAEEPVDPEQARRNVAAARAAFQEDLSDLDALPF